MAKSFKCVSIYIIQGIGKFISWGIQINLKMVISTLYLLPYTFYHKKNPDTSEFFMVSQEGVEPTTNGLKERVTKP